MEGTSWFDDLVLLDPKGPAQQRWRAVSRRLRRERIDVSVLFTNSFHSAFVAWAGRCRRRLGYARDGRSVLLTDRLPAVRGPNGKLIPSPVIDAYNALVRELGCPEPGHRMELATTPVDEASAEAVWHQAGFRRLPEVVCFNPGGAFGSAKHWPVESFAELSRKLVDRRHSGILILCGASEREIAQRIVRLARRPAVHSLSTYPLSLGLTKACIRRADLLVTTDSGPRHFAAAFDRPVITLFGPTHIEWTETYHSRAVHLQKKVDCGPCQLRVCPIDHRCMTMLSPDEVYLAADALLTQDKSAPREAWDNKALPMTTETPDGC
jgi:heptosyltransferase-2